MPRNTKSKRDQKYAPRSYETDSFRGKFIDKNGTYRTDTFFRIYESMLISPAFISLSKNQKLLYMYCKAQVMGKRKPKVDFSDIGEFQGEEYFYLHLQAVVDYGLYKRGGQTQFRRDMQALEDKGFIKKVSSGKYNKSKNIYMLVSDWHGDN